MSAGVLCDHCGEFVPEHRRSIHIERRGPMTYNKGKVEWDFCSEHCLIEWALSYTEPGKTTEVDEEIEIPDLKPCVRCHIQNPTEDLDVDDLCNACARFIAKGG